MNVAGEFDGQLDDAGERLALDAPGIGTVMAVIYNQARGWPLKADGAGHSLVPLVLNDPLGNSLEYGGNWRASAYRGGSPGTADLQPPETVVLNEVLAHTDLFDPTNYPGYDSNDKLEIYNTQGTNVSLHHWYLSDERDELKKWPIPTPSIDGHDWMDYDEVSGFHSPLTNGFGIDKAGEQAFLSYLPGTAADRVADAVRFKGQENGASLGRLPDGAPLWRRLTPTLGYANAAATQDVVVSEIMYHPRSTPAHPGDNAQDEYVVLHNPTDRAIALWTEAGQWRIDGGIRFDFPTNTTMAPDERFILVSFDPATDAQLQAFLQAQGVTGTTARAFGPYDGKLSNSGERIALERPQLPDEFGEPIPWTIVDEVIYADGAPWPIGADGTGRPIVRRSPSQPGNDPANWKTGLHPGAGDAPDRFAITSPAPEATLFDPASTTLRVETDDELVSGAVHRVAIFADGSPCGVSTTMPYAATAHPLDGSEGPHMLYTTLTDDSGTHTSRQVRIIVSHPYNGSASNIAPGSAVLTGWLSHTGRGAVTVFWGRSPGGTNPFAWSNSATLGPVAGAFATPLADLLANASYYHRCYASNLYGSAWARSNASFSTPPPDVSVADTSLSEPVTGSTEAEFTLSLSAASALDVTVRYSMHDGSALSYVDYTPTNGTATIQAGATSIAIPVTIHPDNEDERPFEQFTLRLDSTMNARIGDSNAACMIVDHDQDMNAWTRRARITFAGYGRDTPLTNFPALIKFGGTFPGFTYEDFASGTGGDLRFTDESGTTLLPYEIEKWQEGGVSYVWVLVPELEGTNTAIWAYWGNETETAPPLVLIGPPVWTNGYLGVWHLHADERDSTAGGYDGTPNGTTNTAGLVADARSFDGNNHYITFGDIDAFDQPRRLTASVWFSRRVDRDDHSNHNVDNVLMAQSSKSDNDNFEIGTDGPNVEIYIDSGSGSEDGTRNANIGIQSNTWHHLAVTYDEDDAIEARVYLDGTLVHERTEWGGVFDSSRSSPLSLGIARAGSDNWGDFSGLMDEARVSTVARSSNWVWACWMNQGESHGVFTTYGSAEVVEPGETSHGTPHGWLDAHALVTNSYDEADLADVDGDGMPAWQEYRAGTDPTNSVSVLRFLWIAPGGELAWLAGTNEKNRPFYIYRTTNPPGTVPWMPYATRPRQHGINTWRDPDPAKHRMRFYRIGIPD